MKNNWIEERAETPEMRVFLRLFSLGAAFLATGLIYLFTYEISAASGWVAIRYAVLVVVYSFLFWGAMNLYEANAEHWENMEGDK